jgi:hypothetical protein
MKVPQSQQLIKGAGVEPVTEDERGMNAARSLRS